MSREDGEHIVSESAMDAVRAAWYSSGSIAEVIGGPQSFLAALMAQQIMREGIESAVGSRGENEKGEPS